MADFQNLLGEIDAIQNDENTTLNVDNDFEAMEGGDNDDNDQSQPSQPARIPAALLEAEDQHRKTIEEVLDQDAADDAEQEIMQGGDGLIPDEDYEHLKKLWVREINTTELLEIDQELISSLIELLPIQESNIENFTDQAQQESSARGDVDANLASLASGICKMDFDRMCFLLADLKRTRLGKIERFALHNRQVPERMSNEEVSEFCISDSCSRIPSFLSHFIQFTHYLLLEVG